MTSESSPLRTAALPRVDIQWFVIGGSVVLAAWLSLVPVAFLLWQSFLTPETATAPARFTWENYGTAYFSAETFRLFGNSVAFGEFGLKATDRCRMTAREIEAARRAISRHVKRGGRIWIRVFPDVPITQKPLEVRMGSGKGNVEYWVAKVLPGKVLFEIEGMSEDIAREAFRLASAKLSVSTAFVKRQVRT